MPGESVPDASAPATTGISPETGKRNQHLPKHLRPPAENRFLLLVRWPAWLILAGRAAIPLLEEHSASGDQVLRAFARVHLFLMGVSLPVTGLTASPAADSRRPG